MRFGSGETVYDKNKKLTQWHDFFPIWPRFVPQVGYVWLEPIQRIGSGRFDDYFWSYRLPPEDK